jgi:hypothetical protein
MPPTKKRGCATMNERPDRRGSEARKTLAKLSMLLSMAALTISVYNAYSAAVAIAVLSLLVNVYYIVCECCDLWRK